VVNNALVATGIVGDDGRLQMMYNQTGTIVAMTHILLPFMILPLYSVMRTIPPSYVRAARSLGATSWTAFRRIYLPQTCPASARAAARLHPGGRLLHHARAGRRRVGQLISNLIAFHMQRSLELVAGRGAGGDAARRDPAALLALRPADRHRQHEARLTALALPPTPRRWSAPGTTPTG
jgi:hypothetical protein